MSKLPEEILKNAGRSKITVLIVFPILITLLFNLFLISYFSKYSPNPFYYIVHKKLNILKKIDKKVTWLVLGDSSGNQGVNPSIIEDSTGGSSYNLSTFADMGLVDGCWMLDNLIKRDLAPENVIMVMVYDSWNKNINPALYGQYPFGWIYRNAVEPRIILPKQYRKDVFYSHFLPIFHQAERVRTLVKSPGSIKNELTLIDDKGFNPSPWGYNDRNVRYEYQWHKEFASKSVAYISANNLSAIEYLKKVSETTDINIYLANSPIHDELWMDSTFNTFYSNLTDIIASQFIDVENVHYINNPPMLFEMKYLENADHLTDEGATIFTNHLIKIISDTKNN